MRETGAIGWESFADLALPADPQDHLAGQAILLLDQREDFVALGRVGDKARIFARDFQIDEAQGFFNFADNQPEEPRTR